jgi:hypothetical protein
LAAHIVESARGGAGSVGERLQKYSSFGRFLPDEEYAAATHDFAEPNLPDQQLTARAAKELHIVQACKLIACLRLAHRCVRSERQMAGEQPCRPVKCVTRRLNRMRTTYHGSPTLSPPARNRGKVHPPARLGQGFGHFSRFISNDPPDHCPAGVRRGLAFPFSPADFRKLIADQTEKWAKVIKFAGIKAD